MSMRTINDRNFATLSNLPHYIISVENVTHTFNNGYCGLNKVFLNVKEGEFLLITGRNGSGKTLLIRHILGLKKPDSGSVYFRGQNIKNNVAKLRQHVVMVFQESEAQIVGQTIYEDIAFGPLNLKWDEDSVRKSVEESLNITGLSGLEKRNPDSLSGGEIRRLAIAGVLAMKPECIILDEPFANLDYHGIQQVLGLITKLHDLRKTIIVVTHEIEKLLYHAMRLVIMDRGTIVYDGFPKALEEKNFELFGLMNPYRHGLKFEDLTWLS